MKGEISLKGEAFLIRYADDFVIGVAREEDARRIMEVLPKRMSKYGLTVHPEKTRLIRFHPDPPGDTEPLAGDSSLPRTFDFLGFTHYWGRARKGGWVIKRKTARSRLKRAFQALSDWCRVNRHRPLPVQHQTLKQKLQGHYGYYGIIGNIASLQNFLLGSETDLETMAVPASSGQTPFVVRFRATGTAVRSSQGTCGPQPLQLRSEVMR